MRSKLVAGAAVCGAASLGIGITAAFGTATPVPATGGQSTYSAVLDNTANHPTFQFDSSSGVLTSIGNPAHALGTWEPLEGSQVQIQVPAGGASTLIVEQLTDPNGANDGCEFTETGNADPTGLGPATCGWRLALDGAPLSDRDAQQPQTVSTTFGSGPCTAPATCSPFVATRMSLATSISSLYVSRAPVTPGDHLLQWETFVSPPSWATTGHLTTTGRALRVDVLTTGGTPTFVAQFWQGPWSAMLSAGLLFVSLELWRRARSSRAVMV